MEYGKIRKRAEISLSNRVGMGATEEQIRLVRLWAIQVAEGRISVEDAYNQIVVGNAPGDDKIILGDDIS